MSGHRVLKAWPVSTWEHRVTCLAQQGGNLESIKRSLEATEQQKSEPSEPFQLLTKQFISLSLQNPAKRNMNVLL